MKWKDEHFYFEKRDTRSEDFFSEFDDLGEFVNDV